MKGRFQHIQMIGPVFLWGVVLVSPLVLLPQRWVESIPIPVGWTLWGSATAAATAWMMMRLHRRLRRGLAQIQSWLMAPWTEPPSDLPPQVASIVQVLRTGGWPSDYASMPLASTTRMAVRALLYEALHEIKQPLTVIQGYVQLMRRETMDSAVQADLDTVLTEIQRVLAFIQRVGQAAPIAATPEWTDLGRLLEHMMRMFRPVAEAHGVTVIVERQAMPPVYLYSDEFRHVVWNLLNNAFEALKAQKGEERNLEVRLNHFVPLWSMIPTDAPACGVTLVVRDNGPGIPPERQATLFQPFGSNDEAADHWGFGLAICRYIVEKNGGRIEVHSTPGRGTEVRVWWPCRVPHHQRNM